MFEQPYMKARQDRSNPMATVRKCTVTNSDSGSLGPDHTSQWRSASGKTMAELAAMGKLKPKDVQHALHKGYITPPVFKQVFWDTVDLMRMTKEQLNLINCFSNILL